MKPRLFSYVIISVVFLFVACVLSGKWIGFSQTQGIAASDITLQYGQPRELCNLKDEQINESSGLAAAIRNKDGFWTHNDSGDTARIFLINKSGDTTATVKLKGVAAIDWEDIASFKHGDEAYILIADSGNNARIRENGILYIIHEPEITEDLKNTGTSSLEADPVWTLSYRFEDGPHDCEAVAVDAGESTIYLVSKERTECKIYSMPIPSKESKQLNVAKLIGVLKLPYVPAMDISADGNHAVILTYGDAYMFDRGNGETWGQAFSRAPRIIKMPPRKQGEAICYGADGKTLYLTSENAFQPLWEIPIVENTK